MKAAATDTGPPGQKRRTPRKAEPSKVTAGERMTRRTMDVRHRLVKRLEGLRAKFWKGDQAVKREIVAILQRAIEV